MGGTGSAERVEVEANGARFVATGVNTGNPHMVIFGDAERATAATYGPSLTWHPLWPQGANVEFAEVIDQQHVRLSVWERGCGLTQACGTGATATVAAAVQLGMVKADAPVAVDLPGGRLVITVEDGGTAWMEGPVVEVYRGMLASGTLS